LTKYPEYFDVFAIRAIFKFLQELFWVDLRFHKALPDIHSDLKSHFIEIFLIILANAGTENYEHLVNEYLFSIEPQLDNIRTVYNSRSWEKIG
jgi:hypothetical protein